MTDRPENGRAPAAVPTTIDTQSAVMPGWHWTLTAGTKPNTRGKWRAALHDEAGTHIATMILAPADDERARAKIYREAACKFNGPTDAGKLTAEQCCPLMREVAELTGGTFDAEQPWRSQFGEAPILPSLDMLPVANTLATIGLHVLPISRVAGDAEKSKRPTIGKWRQYQDAAPSADNLAKWFGGAPRNLAVIAGSASGVVVVDTDNAEAEEWAAANLPATPWVVATAKGRHRYYRHPRDGEKIGNRARVTLATGATLALDLRGDGGYVVGPFSVHGSGAVYAPENWPWAADDVVPTFDPAWFAGIDGENADDENNNDTGDDNGAGSGAGWKKISRATHEFLAGAIAEGERNDRLFKAACDLAGCGIPRGEAEAALLTAATRHGTPADEARTTIASAFAAPRKPARGAAPWDDPLPFSTPPTPDPFPLGEALPPILAALAEAVASTIMVSPTAPAAMIPAMLSAAAGNAYSVRVSRSHVEPNLSRFVVWAAPPGERKSATFRAVDFPLTAWIGDAMPQYREALAAYRSDASFWEKVAAGYEKRAAEPKHAAELEQLRADARKAREKIPPAPRKPGFVVGDTTPAQLVRMMHDVGGAAAVFSADGRATVEIIAGCFRGDGCADDAVFLKAHGGDTIDRARAGNSPDGEFLRIERPALALALAVQPDKIAGIAGSGNLSESGFVARLNLCQPESLVGERIETGDEKPVDALVSVGWQNIIHAVIAERWRIIDGERWRPAELRLSSEAMSLRRDFANEIERQQRHDGEYANHTDFASKVAGESARLAALFHLAILAERNEIHDCDRIEISAATWRFAETHQRWQLAETLRVLGMARESVEHRRAGAVLDWAARHPDRCRPLALRDLVRAGVGGIESTEAADAVVAVLMANGWARKAHRQGGESAPRYELHPSIFREGGNK